MSKSNNKISKQDKADSEPSANLLSTVIFICLISLTIIVMDNFFILRAFQNTYTQFDKYSRKSFQKIFNPMKKKILNDENQLSNYNSILSRFLLALCTYVLS